MKEQEYKARFEAERMNSYPAVDLVEAETGYAIDKDWLEQVAFVLNCPVKVNPPNWQHGRVIYSVLRALIAGCQPEQSVVCLDIGTAKGFSACAAAKALSDAGDAWASVPVVSADVIEPESRVRRNTVAEVDGLKTLLEIVSPFVPAPVQVDFNGGGSKAVLAHLKARHLRPFFAFVDGKHSYESVQFEGNTIAGMQRTGDVTIFDDCQLAPVARAVDSLDAYEFAYVDIGPRLYAVGTRK